MRVNREFRVGIVLRATSARVNAESRLTRGGDKKPRETRVKSSRDTNEIRRPAVYSARRELEPIVSQI